MAKAQAGTHIIPHLLTIPEVADIAHVSQDTVRRWLDRRELRYIQTGPRAAKRIALSDLQKWIDRNAVNPLRSR